MNGADNLIRVFKFLVDQMTPMVQVKEIIADGDNWKLTMCRTFNMRTGKTITIDGVDYKIVDFVFGEYIIVSGPSAPVALTFQLPAPKFVHGNRRKVNADFKNQFNLKDDLVYLPVCDVETPDRHDSDIAYTAEVKPLFLTDFIKNRDTIEQQQGDVIEPMYDLAELFIEVINANRAYFEKPQSVRGRSHMNFGDPAVWGNDRMIFDQPLSGVEIRFNLEVLIDGANCCESEPPILCAPVTFRINGVVSDTIPAGNTFPLILKDTNGNAPAYTYDPVTKELEVPAGGSCDPVTSTFNTAPATSTPSGGNKDVIVQTIDSAPIGDKIVDTAGEMRIEVPNAQVNVNGDNFESVAPGSTLNVQILDTGGNPTGVNLGPYIEVSDSDVSIPLNTPPLLLAPIRSQQAKQINIIDAIDGDPVNVILATDTESLAEILLPNGTVNTKDSAGTTLYSDAVKPGGTVNRTITDGSVILKNAQGDTLQTYTNKAQEARVITLPIIYLRPKPDLSSASSVDGDDYWYKLNQPDLYVPPTIGIPALLDPTNPHKLINKNAFGHKWRRTGINGGYYDIDTAGYKLADGTVSDLATTFGTGSNAYLIDHHTGLAYRLSLVGGGKTHAANFATAEAANYSGFTDWMICSIEEHMVLFTSWPNNNFQFPQDPNYYPMVWNSSFRFRTNLPSAPSTTFRTYIGGTYSIGTAAANNAWLPVRRHYT